MMTSGPAMSRYCVTCHPAATTQAREESIDVELDWPSAEEMEEARRTAERQQRWRAESVEKQQAARAARARELADGAQTIERALDAYKDLPDLAPTVRIRTDFVALRSARPLSPALGGPEPGEALDGWEFRREDRRTRPPMSKLLIRRTHALPSYLAMLYVAHTEASIVQAGRRNRHANASRVNGQESWAVLCGRWAPTTRARRARMVRDLDELLGADLVSIGPHGKQGRYEGFGMLSDDTTDRDYRLPSPTLDWPDVISLPASFFLRGWHLVLTPAEIAILLMARRATLAIPDTSDEPGVGIPQSIRWSRYGISGEAYGAIHELEEFGLIMINDTMPHRRRGKFRPLPSDQRAQVEAEGESMSPVPYRLIVEDDTVFDRPALTTVHKSLTDHPAPPRLSA